MRKLVLKLFLSFSLIAINQVTFGVTAYPFPVEITQSDGTKITIILKGDEHVKWAQTVDGYSIMRNNQGVFEYAMLDTKNDMVLSGIQVKDRSERSSSDNQFLSKTKKDITYSNSQVGMMKSISKMYTKSPQKAFPTTGTRKLVCILIGFTDKAFTKTQSDFNNLLNQVGYNVDGATGSVYDFYKENSFNQLDLSVTVAGPYTAAHNMAYYGANSGGFAGNDVDPRALVTEAVNLANPDVNYANFDNDGDGSVDGVYIIYAGYGEEAGASGDAIWAHAWSISPVVLDGKTISRYSCSSELRGNSGTGLTRIGVICHEFGHVMGAADYYDTDYATNGSYTGTGYWDLMASGSWNNNGATPAHHNSYTKIFSYGWATATTLSLGTTITLNNSEQNSNSFYRVNTATANEFFLIENRQQHKFDSYIPGHGMIIYHVDGSYISTAGNSINAGSHQGMYPVCADATGNPPTTYGTINGSGCPFPGTGSKTSFTDVTTPNALSWAAANTAKPITAISENTTDKTVSFTFMGGVTCTPPTTQATTFTSSAIADHSMTIGWTRGNGNAVLVVARKGGAVNENPTNGVVYNADVAFGSGYQMGAGNYVVYNGTGTSVGLSTLISGSSYYYAIYEYNSATNCYLSPALTGNATTTGIAPITYCSATTTTCDEHISNVTFGTINNSTTCTSGGYTDYSALSTDIAKGASLGISVTNGSLSYPTDQCGIWVDWNNNGDFSDDQVITVTGTPGVGPYTATITCPSGSSTGPKRVRVRVLYTGTVLPCGNTTFGEVEDYTINVISPCTPPTIQATTFTSSVLADHSMTIGWTRGNGNAVLVVAKAGGAVSADPVYGTTYTANSAFGSGTQIGTGNYVIYNGTGNSVNVTALTSGTNYNYAIYEYSSSTNCYLTPALAGNATTTGIPPITYCTTNLGGSGSCPGDITALSISSTTFNNTTHSNCSIANSSTYALYLPTGGNTCDLVVGATYTINVTTSSSDIISIWIDYDQNGIFDATEWTQVSTQTTIGNPSSINFTVPNTSITGQTGLRIRSRAIGNTNGAIDACTTFGSGITEDYTINILQPCIPPTSQSTAFTFSALANNSMTIGWTRGNGNAVLVVARASSAVNADPVYGTTYTANSAFGSGIQIGIGNYVIYNGTGNSVNVTALTSGTNYNYAIYEYNSSTNCYKIPALTGNVTTIGLPQFTNFQEANIVVGQSNFTTQSTIAAQSTTPSANASAISTKGVLAVATQNNGRVLIWNQVPTTNGKPADVIVGKLDFTSTTSGCSQSIINGCNGVCFSPDGNKLIVSDSWNNRVLIWNSIPTFNGQAADIVIGQTDFVTSSSGCAANKFNSPTGVLVTLDGKLLINEFYNNRVLIFNKIPTTNGASADVVIGQPDMVSNGTGSGSNQLSQTWYSAISPEGKLLISDELNHRVLIYNSVPSTNGASADNVIGQSGFNLNSLGTSASKLKNPVGVTVSPDGKVAIGEFGNSRVLIFNSIPITNGASADIVLGQPDFTSNTAFNGGVSAKSMCRPYGINFDLNGRLFVNGRDMHRVMIYGNVPTQKAELSLNFSSNTIDLCGGSSVQYVLRITNNGPDNATNVIAQSMIPAGFTPDGVIIASSGTYNATTGWWNIPSIPNGGSQTLIFNGRIQPSVTITAYANISSSEQEDINFSNNAASVTVTSSANVAPLIVQHPSNQFVLPTNPAVFTVSATGTSLSYHWQVNTSTGVFADLTNGATYSGVTSNTLNISNVNGSMNNYLYRCVVSGAGPCTAISNAASLITTGSCTPPTSQAASFTSSAIAHVSMTANWVRGDGTGVLVVARQGSAVNAYPVNGTIYNANATFSSGTQIGVGNYVVYSGAGTSVNLTNLNSGTGYYFAIYEYSATNCYKTPALTGNAITLCVSPSAPTVGTITQSTCSVATGSVNLSGLPAIGTWALTRTPGGTITTGTGISTTISGLAAGTYTYTVTNATGCTSAASANVVINAQPPTPSVTNQSISILTGGTFVVTPSGVPVGTKYTWTTPVYTGGVTGGSAQTIPQSNINGSLTIPSGTGTAIYTVTPTSGVCVGATFTVTVTVTSTCVPVTIVTQPVVNSMCVTSGNATFTVAANGTFPFTYQWQYNNGSSWQNVTNGTPAGASYSNTTTATLSVTSITIAGNPQYRCYITNCSGASNATTAAATLTVYALPTSPIVGTITQPTCAVATGGVELSGLPATGTWTLTRTPGGTITTGTGTSTTLTGLVVGTYTYMVANASGCTSVASGNVVIIANPVTPATPTVGAITQPICALSTGSVVLGSLPATGTWTLTRTPGGITTTGTGVSTTISGLVVGTYTYTVTNASGCSSAASANVVIIANPTTPATPTVGSIIQPTCAVATGSLVLNSLPSTGTWTLIRNPGGIITTGTGTSATISGLAAGTYTYTVANASGCTSITSGNAVINVQPATPSAPTVGTITQPTVAVAKGSVFLNDLPTTGSWTLTRTPGGTTTTGSGISTTILGLASGTYTYTVTNAAGCTSGASGSVVINAQPTGIDDINSQTANYLGQNYPNPFDQSTSIDFTLVQPNHVNLSVFNTLGKEVDVIVNEYLTAGIYTKRWEPKNLPIGIYYYQLRIEGFKATRRLIIMK